ncbi:DUF6882 domain-containing protein [Polymorphospora sp. NPDC050346]|uniref:DUF6882 domain-containing protein n=1 Tax=Polymorphospora sp. NPDC050346 TaxID=3155780 RepID=UPI00340B66DC
MTEPLTLDDLVNDAAFYSWEHQEHLIDLTEQLGEHRFHVDLNARRLDLLGAGTLSTTLGMLGSTSERLGTWLWGWANPSGFTPEVTAMSLRVAEFGRQHGIRELADAEVPLTPDLAPRLTEAAKVVTRCWTGYSLAAGPGTRVHLLIDGPELALPAPNLPRTVRVIGEALANGLVRDHRRALLSYAHLRRLRTKVDGSTVRLRLPEGVLTVTFDSLGRIGGMSGEMVGRGAA